MVDVDLKVSLLYNSLENSVPPYLLHQLLLLFFDSAASIVAEIIFLSLFLNKNLTPTVCYIILTNYFNVEKCFAYFYVFI